LSNQFIHAIEAELDDLKSLIFEPPASKKALIRAKEAIDRKVHSAPESPSGIFARYLRARSYEEGVLGKQDVDAALEDYSFIMAHGADLRSEGMVGCARLLHWKDKNANTAKALALCAQAIRLDSNVRAMMFMGYIYEHTAHDLESAAKWYLEAFKNKLPWGLRFYASVQFKRRKFLTSIFSHIAATIVGPFMVLRYGKRDAFKL
jgi:TPR repeat protein